MNPQEFLKNRIDSILSGKALEQIGYAKAHPVLGVVNAVSKATGGPGLTEGFIDGVSRKDGRNGTYEIVVPPMPF